MEEWEKFRDIVMERTKMYVARDMKPAENKGECGETKKWVGRWPKTQEFFRSGFRYEIGLPMIDTGHIDWF